MCKQKNPHLRSLKHDLQGGDFSFGYALKRA